MRAERWVPKPSSLWKLDDCIEAAIGHKNIDLYIPVRHTISQKKRMKLTLQILPNLKQYFCAIVFNRYYLYGKY